MTPQTYSSNGVTLYMRPSRNLLSYRVLDTVRTYDGYRASEAASDEQNWISIVTERFMFLECLTQEPFCESEDDTPYSIYFEQRSDLSLRQRFTLYEELFDIDDMNFIYDAYVATRKQELMLELPDNIDSADDEKTKKNTSSTGSKNSRKKKVSRNGKINPEISTKKETA